ncbi:uncharacterized protein TRIADDRAFT_55378 [Trichoplax adhaerens]|uniref:Uncharacterized protein n=1 Tax=Trichoplax adhaerens TaxID=10228 RepID=B3RUQ9_TRIAD|nr:predicted protein [Trichoplax adhaerens]EDV25863.1 predicted protein [Trichoplax adhaerens]|eukprot:XP_002111896.1 predicted protein [Trichoplax adhaerens]
MTGFMASTWLQGYPYHFLPIPVLHQLPFPYEMYTVFLIIGITFGCLTIIALIPVVHCGGEEAENSIAYRDEKILKYTEREFIFRLSWYVGKLSKTLRQLTQNVCDIQTWWKFITMLIVLLCCAPFAIINKLSLEYYAFRKADVITYRLCQKFHCHSKKLSHSKAFIKAAVYIISVLYCSVEMFLIWSVLQLLIRILITSTAFIIAHSNFFSAYLAPSFPFIYFTRQALQGYSADKILLSKNILDLQDEIQSDIDDYLSNDDGQMEILFIVTPKGVEVDLPIRLENLREVIRARLELLAMECDTEFRYEQQCIFVKFQLDKIDENGSKIYDVEFSRFNNDLNDLRQKIMVELSDQHVDALQLSLKPFYYNVKSTSDENTEVGIPIEFHRYLSNHAPRLAANFSQLITRVIAIACIAACFITAVASFNIINNITTLSNTLSGTVISHVTMMASMAYLTDAALNDDQKQNILKKYIMDYILGYNFFYTRALTKCGGDNFLSYINNDLNQQEGQIKKYISCSVFVRFRTSLIESTTTHRRNYSSILKNVFNYDNMDDYDSHCVNGYFFVPRSKS